MLVYIILRNEQTLLSNAIVATPTSESGMEIGVLRRMCVVWRCLLWVVCVGGCVAECLCREFARAICGYKSQEQGLNLSRS